ncbi:TPA: hypothetical protein ACGN28_002087 [Streptococcus agalactiae]
MKKLEQLRQESKEIKDKIDNTEERLRQIKDIKIEDKAKLNKKDRGKGAER